MFSIPNLLTAVNLFCGLLSLTVLGFFNLDEGEIIMTVGCLMFASLFFDFLDGFLAKLLNKQSAIGVQLDSLADLISFGVVPAFLLLKYFSASEFEFWVDFFNSEELFSANNGEQSFFSSNKLVLQEVVLPQFLLALVILCIPVFSAFRLAKFNIEGSKNNFFLGLPTPANAVWIFSLVAAIHFQPDGLVAELFDQVTIVTFFILLLSLLLIANIPLFSFKLKDLSINKYLPQVLFIPVLILFVISLKWSGLFLAMVSYIVLSLAFRKKIECQ